MTNKIAMGTVFLVLAHGLSGCSGSRSSPSSPSAVLQPPPPPVPSLIVFTDKASGFSTPDLRDAQEQIVQFNTAAELIWTADGTPSLDSATNAKPLTLRRPADAGWSSISGS